MSKFFICVFKLLINYWIFVMNVSEFSLYTYIVIWFHFSFPFFAWLLCLSFIFSNLDWLTCFAFFFFFLRLKSLFPSLLFSSLFFSLHILKSLIYFTWGWKTCLMVEEPSIFASRLKCLLGTFMLKSTLGTHARHSLRWKAYFNCAFLLGNYFILNKMLVFESNSNFVNYANFPIKLRYLIKDS